MTASSAAVHFSFPKAHKAQAHLSKKIIPEDRLPSNIRFVAGVDVAYAGDTAIGAAVVLDYESLEILEQQTATCSVKLPIFQLCFPLEKSQLQWLALGV